VSVGLGKATVSGGNKLVHKQFGGLRVEELPAEYFPKLRMVGASETCARCSCEYSGMKTSQAVTEATGQWIEYWYAWSELFFPKS